MLRNHRQKWEGIVYTEILRQERNDLKDPRWLVQSV